MFFTGKNSLLINSEIKPFTLDHTNMKRQVRGRPKKLTDG
jgi:hypothetical protein